MSQTAHPQSKAKEPPPVDAPPEAQMQPQIPQVEVIYQPVRPVECQRAPAEAPAELLMTFTVMDGGITPKRLTFLVQEPGFQAIRDCVTGRLVIP